MEIITSLLITLLSLLIVSLIKRNVQGRNPPGPFALPLIGNFYLFRKNSKDGPPHLVIQKLYQKYGPVYRLQLGSTNVVVLTEPHIFKEAFIENDCFVHRYLRPSRILANKQLNLTSSNGEFNKKARSIVSSAITVTKFKKVESSLQEEVAIVCEMLRELAESGEVIDPQRMIKTCTLNIILKFIISQSLDYKDGGVSEPLIEMINHFLKISGQPFPSDNFPFLRPILKGHPKSFYDNFNCFAEWIDGIIKERLKIFDSKQEPKDLLDEYLGQYEKNEISLEAITYILMDCVLAGTDTSANTVLFLILMMINYPENQEKMFNELKTVIGDNLPSLSDKSNTPIVNATIKETLRRFPPAPLGLSHFNNENVEMFGFIIPKHTQIIQNIYSTCLSSNVWENPLKFDPTRFINDQDHSEYNNKTRLVFGTGVRNCVGATFAENEIYLIVSTIFSKFKFSRTSNDLVSEDVIFGVTMSPTSNLKVKVEVR